MIYDFFICFILIFVSVVFYRFLNFVKHELKRRNDILVSINYALEDIYDILYDIDKDITEGD